MNAKHIVKDKNQINIVLQEREKNLSMMQTIEKEKSPLHVIEHYFTSFVGLDDLKNSIKQIYATKLINDKRKENGLLVEEQVLHMIFTGNPGTGKTTVARQLASTFLQLNLLPKGHFIEAERADLVGEYIGQTAQKTRTLVQRALGGVLFIDEAYSLARGGEKDFGREAIDTLVKQMEDYASQFVLILAGYPKEMYRFLQINPGLSSRFPFKHEFSDYSVDELINIAEQITNERQYELTTKSKWKLKHHLRKKMNQKDINFSNGRYVRNLIEKAIRMQALRLIQRKNYTYDDLLYIEEEDLLWLNTKK